MDNTKESTQIVFKDDGIYGEIQLFSSEKKAGKMDISVSAGKLRVYHTEVDPAYEGLGFAKLLLNRLVSYAREENLRIIALCPYVMTHFKRRPEDYADVWLKK